MRSCAVCFFYGGVRGAEEGDCMVDPPVPVLVSLVDTATGVEARFTSVRPLVGAQDFCARFSHRHEKPVARPAQVG